MTDQAIAILAEALNQPTSDIGPQTSLVETPAWDSLAHMRVVLAIEDRLGRQLKPDEVVSIIGFDDVVNLLSS